MKHPVFQAQQFFRFFNVRLIALIRKEIAQIRRNKQLIFLLTVSPILQLLIFGFAISPEVNHLQLGVLDYAHVPESRELIAAFTANQVFEMHTQAGDRRTLIEQVRQGEIDVGIIIPPDFNTTLRRNQSADVQVLIDGVNAYTAGVANGYVSQIISHYNRRIAPASISLATEPHVIFRYNPGLESSWFFVPGVMGTVLTLVSSLASAVEAVRERDEGTLEQVLMTPANALEILLAKVIPLFGLLLADVLLALAIARYIFHVPFRGSILLFLLLSSIYVLIGISIGMLLATISSNKRQTILTSFFINSPLVMLSGALSATESMPTLFRTLSYMNPLYHYIQIVRGILLRGVGLEVLWSNALVLIFFAVVLLTNSTWRFRRQLV
ncbi:ABC transporter permease [Fischerella thermalis BR2B]|jgi:ABC-2 type transport system permease protein|uniref:ABC transporter permease n=1 Tax=Fischerella thermalis TaxID=372787 RepID=UPI0002F166F5|nr:ABC transporter permease [Fischerella thermalis]PMB30674.1 ABC transporter permease [Fischerella thermalis CCMEE 5208]PMB32019.1 ABC transporter permease [Fischerella thermalis BR2B]